MRRAVTLVYKIITWKNSFLCRFLKEMLYCNICRRCEISNGISMRSGIDGAATVLSVPSGRLGAWVRPSRMSIYTAALVLPLLSATTLTPPDQPVLDAVLLTHPVEDVVEGIIVMPGSNMSARRTRLQRRSESGRQRAVARSLV